MKHAPRDVPVWTPVRLIDPIGCLIALAEAARDHLAFVGEPTVPVAVVGAAT